MQFTALEPISTFLSLVLQHLLHTTAEIVQETCTFEMNFTCRKKKISELDVSSRWSRIQIPDHINIWPIMQNEACTDRYRFRKGQGKCPIFIATILYCQLIKRLFGLEIRLSHT